jgi:hypothetical protein
VSISFNKIISNLEKILDLRISFAWKGYGSALFLELGDLHEELAWKKDGKITTTKVGKWTLSSVGSWKVIKEKKILIDAEQSKESELEETVKGFEGQVIKSVDVKDKLLLRLSNNEVLEFNKADYGFFNLVLNEKTTMGYENNKPYIQQISL